MMEEKRKRLKMVKSRTDGSSVANSDTFKTVKRHETAKIVDTGLISNNLFDHLPISDTIKKGLEGMNLTEMTEFQVKCIPHLLGLKDVLAITKAGNGKTITYLIPVLERILQNDMQGIKGTCAIIIAHTREFSLRIYKVLQELAACTQIRIGLIRDGSNRQTEVENLQGGVAILVATPNRLLDHLTNTKKFLRNHLKILVIDDADRLLDTDSKMRMGDIIQRLPKDRKSVIFSTTANKNTHKLAKLVLKANYVMINPEEQSDKASETFEQGYVVCNPAVKFSLLCTFLKRNKDKKIVVFMSTCREVEFYSGLLNFVDMPVLAIHGRQNLTKQTSTLVSFVEASSAILLCSDVSARDLDVSKVDWIVQFDPPDDPKDYIHRVGRVARMENRTRTLLILRPHELGILEFLRNSRVNLVEYNFGLGKVADMQPVLEKLVSSNYSLALSAHEAFKSIVQSYNSYKLGFFNIKELDLEALAKTFGLQVIPRVEVEPSDNFETKQLKRKAYGKSNVPAKKTKVYKMVR